MKTLRTYFLLIFCAVAVVLVLLGALFYAQQQRLAFDKAANELSSITELKVAQLQNWRHERIADAYVLSNSPYLTRELERWLKERDDKGREELTKRLRLMIDQYKYSDVMFLDMDGKIQLALAPENCLHPEGIAGIRQAIDLKKPVFVDFHPSDTSVPHLSVVAPVFSTEDSNVPLGGLVLSIDVNQFIYPMLQSWPLKRETTETLLARRDGDSVLFLTELRYRKDTALKLKLPLTDENVPAVMAVLGKEGVVKGNDYRGVKVFSSIKAVPDSPWFIVSKIDQDESMAEWKSKSTIIIGSLLLSLLAMAFATYALWQRQSKYYLLSLMASESRCRTSEERFKTTLTSIGDGVIAMDKDGNIEFMNPIAEYLTGWASADAKGKRLADVFKIIKENTREPVENPVSKVLKEGKIVGLANHTLLISKDGTERPIADSGAPILGQDNEITGVVLVFRDQTDQKRLEEIMLKEKDKIENILNSSPVGMMVFDENLNIIYANSSAESMFCNKPLPNGMHCGNFIRCINRNKAEGGCGFSDRCKDCKLSDAIRRTVSVEDSISGEVLLEIEGNAKHQHIRFMTRRMMVAGRKAAVIALDDISEQKRMEEEKINLQEMLHQARKMEAIGTLAGGVAHDFNNMLQVIIGHAHLSLEDNSLPSMLRESLVEIEKAARRSATLTKQLLGFARKQTVKHEVLNLNETISEILNMLRRLIGENIKFDWIPGKDLWNIKMDSSQVDQILANLTVNGRDAIKGTGRISIETYNSVIDRFLCSEHPEYVPGDYAVIAVSDTGRGMDKESLSHIFEPFYTTKGPGKGTGLGLATVYGIVKQNNGFINVYSEPEHGTTFKIYLPRTLENMIKTKDAGETILKRGSETILMVEDELAILLLGKTMLEQFGYKVITAGNPETACQAAMKCKDEIKLLITDVVMPEMNGKQMLEKIRAICPDVKAMYMSGYTANVIAHQGILEENVAFIQKPFSMHELSKKVREALDNS